MSAEPTPAYTLGDPHTLAAEAPYTFFLPKVAPGRPAPGDHVKLMFEQTRDDRSNGAERMWVTITAVDGDTLTGVLASQPDDLPELTPGQVIRFERRLMLDVVAPDGEPLAYDDTTREYWTAATSRTPSSTATPRSTTSSARRRRRRTTASPSAPAAGASTPPPRTPPTPTPPSPPSATSPWAPS